MVRFCNFRMKCIVLTLSPRSTSVMTLRCFFFLCTKSYYSAWRLLSEQVLTLLLQVIMNLWMKNHQSFCDTVNLAIVVFQLCVERASLSPLLLGILRERARGNERAGTALSSATEERKHDTLSRFVFPKPALSLSRAIRGSESSTLCVKRSPQTPARDHNKSLLY